MGEEHNNNDNWSGRVCRKAKRVFLKLGRSAQSVIMLSYQRASIHFPRVYRLYSTATAQLVIRLSVPVVFSFGSHFFSCLIRCCDSAKMLFRFDLTSSLFVLR